jgi:type 1 glutamine amidotransferase
MTSAAVGATKPHIVIMIGEDEYKTWDTVPEWSRAELEPRGFRVTIIQADEKEKNHFPGLVTALRDADLLFISVRRRAPLKEELDAIRNHWKAGKPIVGIRTACHAFALRGKDSKTPEGHDQWETFDPEVLGGHYTSHHGNGPNTTVTVSPGASKHPILQGIDITRLTGNGSLYKVSPLESSAEPLLTGSIPNTPAEPIAWTRRSGPKQARIFFTSLGHWDDFKNPEFRRMLVNAVTWATAKPGSKAGNSGEP